MGAGKSPNIDMEAVRQEEEEKARGFQLIGEFIFWFSQLEFTIKSRLAAALRLDDAIFDSVTAPYDFAVLCTVATKVSVQRNPTKEAEITKIFNECRKLNDERVRIAHGLWTHGTDGLVARHAARGTLEAKFFYENPVALSRLTETARRLMIDVTEVPREPKEAGRVELIGIEILMDDEHEKQQQASGRKSRRRGQSGATKN